MTRRNWRINYPTARAGPETSTRSQATLEAFPTCGKSGNERASETPSVSREVNVSSEPSTLKISESNSIQRCKYRTPNLRHPRLQRLRRGQIRNKRNWLGHESRIS